VLGELEENFFRFAHMSGTQVQWGLITPSPNPVGIIADFICSALNQNIGAYTIGPAAWPWENEPALLYRLVGYNDKAGGNLNQWRNDGELIGLKCPGLLSSDRIQQMGFRNAGQCYASESGMFR